MLLGVYNVAMFFFFKQKTAYEMRISDWSSDVCSSDLYHLFDEAAADEKAGLLEQVWNADTAYNNAVGLWMDQERQRLLDIANGAPEYPAAKHPVPDVSIRIQSRAQLIRAEVMEIGRAHV